MTVTAITNTRVMNHINSYKLYIAGDADHLSLTDSLYLGGVPPPPFTGPHPPQLWSVSSRGPGAGGYVGCIRDLVINGVSVQLSDLAKIQDLGSIVSGCQWSGDQCSRPYGVCPVSEETPGHCPLCRNNGQCIAGWNRFQCDCTQTNFTGPTCARGEKIKFLY